MLENAQRLFKNMKQFNVRKNSKSRIMFPELKIIVVRIKQEIPTYKIVSELHRQ